MLSFVMNSFFPRENQEEEQVVVTESKERSDLLCAGINEKLDRIFLIVFVFSLCCAVKHWSQRKNANIQVKVN